MLQSLNKVAVKVRAWRVLRQVSSVIGSHVCATWRCASCRLLPDSHCKSGKSLAKSPATVFPSPDGIVAATNRYCLFQVRLATANQASLTRIKGVCHLERRQVRGACQVTILRGVLGCTLFNNHEACTAVVCRLVMSRTLGLQCPLCFCLTCWLQGWTAHPPPTQVP